MLPGLLEPGFVWENILKYKDRTGGEKTLQYTVWHSFSLGIMLCLQCCLWCARALFMASSNRSKFLEMCEGLLARVEPPLRSVLDQASKWGGVGVLCMLIGDSQSAGFLCILDTRVCHKQQLLA